MTTEVRATHITQARQAFQGCWHTPWSPPLLSKYSLSTQYQLWRTHLSTHYLELISICTAPSIEDFLLTPCKKHFHMWGPSTWAACGSLLFLRVVCQGKVPTRMCSWSDPQAVCSQTAPHWASRTGCTEQILQDLSWETLTKKQLNNANWSSENTKSLLK